ncbi:MAG: hypothetical protein ACXQTR_02640 [Candidatus Methanospirareceae archaeon]
MEEAEAEIRALFSLPVHIDDVPERCKDALTSYCNWCLAHDGLAPRNVEKAVALLSGVKKDRR